jgi:hypothetical protein
LLHQASDDAQAEAVALGLVAVRGQAAAVVADAEGDPARLRGSMATRMVPRSPSGQACLSELVTASVVMSDRVISVSSGRSVGGASTRQATLRAPVASSR